jgi:CRISP-associated protein Cas1
MRKLLNTLYVTTPEAYLTKDGENVVVKVDSEEKFRIPIHNIEGIIVFNYLGASPSLMALCAERQVGLSFHNAGGRFLARVSGPVKGNVLLRRKQYRLADDKQFSLEISKLFILGKIFNCKNILARAIRDHGNESNKCILENAMQLQNTFLKQVDGCTNHDSLRGAEGMAANTYFEVFNHLIVSQKDSFIFNGRSRRPPKDNVNAMLSYVYTLLAHEVQSALESVGIDPYVGFLHTDRPGRPSLALDMMEEFRPYLADRLVLSLINRKQVSASGFSNHSESGILMNDATRKELLNAWQKRKQDEIKHPFLGETIPIGLLPYVQALLLARFLRGDLDNYPVFFMK